MSDVLTNPMSFQHQRHGLSRQVMMRFNTETRDSAFIYALVATAMLLVSYQSLMDWFVFYEAYVAHVEWAYLWLWLLAFGSAVSAALFCHFCMRGIDYWLDWTLSICYQRDGWPD